MNKVYLLLRDNKQTGPYSLDELMQYGLKPFDLIWVEGKSSCWSYPSEIDILKPYLATTNEATTNKEEAQKKEISVDSQQTVHQAYMPSDMELAPAGQNNFPKSIYVSLPQSKVQQIVSMPDTSPSSSLEQKAEELRKKALAYSPESKAAQEVDQVQTKFSRSLNQAEEEYTTWVFSKKSQNKNRFLKRRPTVVVGLLLIAGVYITVKYGFDEKEATMEGLTAKPTFQNNEIQPLIVDSVFAEARIEEKENISPDYVAPEQEVANKTSQKMNFHSPPKSTSLYKPPEIKVTEDKIEKLELQEELNKDVVSEAEKEDNIVSSSREKKKTFGEKIEGFFKKFNDRKIDESEEQIDKPEEQPQIPNRNVGAERKAVRRGQESASNNEITNLDDFVDISSIESPGNWMLGINGMKLTLNNRSTETVRNAAVEVRYYNEHKELIDKKVVSFTNVLPKKSLTVAAPDHRLADHADFRLLSASN